MSKDTQYSRPLFIEDFSAGSQATSLESIHLSKSAPDSAAYDEGWLQRLIMNQTSLLPVDQIERAFVGMVPVCIELPTPSGFVDNLLVTPAGDIALIECKLWRNPQARREVVGQIIDYAKDLAAWSYQDLEAAIRRTEPFDAHDGERPRSLYETVAESSEIDEASFVDAVSRNLRRGRFLLLIVGDGIREGVESMTEFLQQYAGLHFTLAIVEIALFKVPTGGYIAQPRVLARTTNIDRGIVTIDNAGRVSIKPADTAPPTSNAGAPRMTITKERYLEELEKSVPGVTDKLNAFLGKLEAYGVSPEFGSKSIVLRWYDDTMGWNLGTIPSSGQFWASHMTSQAEGIGLVELSKKYMRSLAELVPGAHVKETPKVGGWYIAQNGKFILIDELLADDARQDGWLRAIADFQAAVAKSNAD